MSDVDYMPYMKLSYANGPGYTYHTNSEGRLNLTAIGQLGLIDYEFEHPATVPMVLFLDC